MAEELDDLRQLERGSIHQFLVESEAYIRGFTLDYGCGRQPYRQIIEQAGATYHGYDRGFHPGAIRGVGDVGDDDPLLKFWDTIICTQVLNVIPDYRHLLRQFHASLRLNGYLILTAATCWPDGDPVELWRWTLNGIRLELEAAGFRIEHLRYRGEWLGFQIGFGCVAGRA
jgi:hypothetical protein